MSTETIERYADTTHRWYMIYIPNSFIQHAVCYHQLLCFPTETVELLWQNQELIMRVEGSTVILIINSWQNCPIHDNMLLYSVQNVFYYCLSIEDVKSLSSRYNCTFYQFIVMLSSALLVTVVNKSITYKGILKTTHRFMALHRTSL